MATNIPAIETQAQQAVLPARDYKSPGQQQQVDLLMMFLKGLQDTGSNLVKGYAQRGAQQQQSDLDSQGLQQLLGIKAQEEAKHPGSQVSLRMGNAAAESNPSPGYGLDKFRLQAGNKAVGDVLQSYDVNSRPLLKQVEALNSLKDVISNNNQMTVGLAQTAMLSALGMNRYNENEAKNQIQPSLAARMNRWMSAATGEDKATLTDSQVKDLRDFISQKSDSLLRANDTIKKQAIERFRQSRFYDPSQEERLQSGLGQAISSQLSEIKKFPDSSKQPLGASLSQANIDARKHVEEGLEGSYVLDKIKSADKSAQDFLAKTPTGMAVTGLRDYLIGPKKDPEGSLMNQGQRIQPDVPGLGQVQPQAIVPGPAPAPQLPNPGNVSSGGYESLPPPSGLQRQFVGAPPPSAPPFNPAQKQDLLEQYLKTQKSQDPLSRILGR